MEQRARPNQMAGETIVAVATPPGRSALALVRVSGPAVERVLATHFEFSGGLGREALGHGGLSRGAWTGGMKLPAAGGFGSGVTTLPLPVRVCMYVGPASYTGEDLAEILVPGNPELIERVLGVLCGVDGVRAAEPGEFSARAYLNGKLTLEQAEGVGAVIAATSEAELESARRVMNGEAGTTYRAWADEVATLLALVEAGVDFSDQEDVVAIEPDELVRRATRVRDEIRARLGATGEGRQGGERREGSVRVALVGVPNAGKSTLMNALVGRRRAVVSDTPGTTRDVLVERLDPGAWGVTARGEIELLDLAGLEEVVSTDPAHPASKSGRTESHAPIEREAQRLAIEAIASAEIWVWCDPKGCFEAEMFERLGVDVERTGRAGRAVIRVRTKGDRVKGGGEIQEGQDVLSVCALDGWNLGILVGEIVRRARELEGTSPEVVVTRHRKALLRSVEALDGAIREAERGAEGGGKRGSTGRGGDPAVVAAGLRSGLDELGLISGAMSPDDVLGRIFASFCIGK